MKDKAILIEMLFEKIESYIKTTLELYRLKAIDKVTDIFATLASSMILGLIVALSFILLSVGLALFLGELLGKSYYGFFAIGGLYAAIGIVVGINRREWLEVKLNNFLINQIFKKKDHV